MSDESLPEDRHICANCRALNPPQATICVSCGVHLETFRAAAPRLRELQESDGEAHARRLTDEASSRVAREVASGKRLLGLQLWVLLAATGVLAIVVVLGAAYFANRARLRQERLANEYQEAQACLQAQDYLCARNKFENLLFEEPEYPGVRENFIEAHYGLAQQYTRSGKWKAAIGELDALLELIPGDEDALSLMKKVYDRWIDDAISRGNLITAWSIRRQRDARFPPNE